MKATRSLALIIAVLMLGLSVVGCSSSSTSQDPASTTSEGSTSGSTSASGSGETKTDLVIAASEDISGFDTSDSNAMATQFVMRSIYLMLFWQNENQEYVPYLAESYETPDDNTFIVNIHQGVQYEDGTEVTIDDVIYCLNRARENVSLALLLGTVESIEKTGDYQLTIHTTGPSPSLPLALYHPGTAILPQSYIEENDASGDWSDPICSGPYKVKSRTVGTEVVLEKNENFFLEEEMAQNDTLTIRCVPEASSRTIMVETGEVDVNKNFTTADYSRATSSDVMTLHTAASTTMQYWGFDVTLEPFSNKTVRQAMNYAVNRDDVIAVAADGLATPLYTVLAPDCYGYVENPAGYTYDTAKAIELLTEAGYPNGFNTQISCFNDINARIAEVIQVCVAAVNVNAEIMRYETSVRADMTQNHQTITNTASWGCYIDPDLVLPRLFGESGIGGSNGSFYSNPELEEVLVAGRTYDMDARIAAYEEAQAIIMEDAPWVPLYVGESYALTTKDLQGVVVGTDGIYMPWRLHY